MLNSTNDEELMVGGEKGIETQSDADVDIHKSTASLSTNMKDDIDNKKEQAVLQELLDGMDTEISEGMSPPKAKYIKSENDIHFDAYTDGVNIHKKYQFRRKVKPVIKTDTSDSNHKYVDEAPSYPCTKCKKAFNSKTGLLNHMRMHQTVKVFTCSLCEEKFDTNILLLKHKFIHEGEDRVFLCKTCEMAFTDHCDYLIHEISHKKRSTYKCPECGSYQTPRYIKTHIEQHFNRGVKCEECDKLFKTTSSLNQHISYYHNEHNKIECVECGKMLTDKKAYNRHMTVHTGVGKYQCLYCGKGFPVTQARDVHTRTHTDERPYHCTQCPRSFRQDTDLKKHTLTHGEKTFECHMCGKKFLHSVSLKSHMMAHNQQYSLHCPICNKGCQTRTALRVHVIYKHSTERSYKCDLCDVSFKDGNGIRKHNNSKAHKRAEYAARNKS